MPHAFEISSTGSHFLGSSGAKVRLAMMGSLTPYIQGLCFFFWLRLQECVGSFLCFPHLVALSLNIKCNVTSNI